MIRSLLILSLVLLATGADSLRAGRYVYDAAARGIYEQILELRLDPAAAALARFRRAQPDNLVAEHLLSYLDFFRVYVSEDPALYAAQQTRRTAALDRLAEKGDAGSAYHRYLQAELLLHGALLDIRFESYLPAFRAVNRAHKLLLDNQERFPDFSPNYKDLGLLHAAFGTVPDQYRWGVKLLSSLRGTVAEGRREMERALRDTDSPFYRETRALYIMLLLQFGNDPDRAWREVQAMNLRAGANPLECYLLAHVALQTDRNDQAIRYLEQQPRGDTFTDFPYLDFMLGLAKIHRLDPTARLHFQSYLTRYRGEHGIKEARQKIAWSELLRGNLAGYREQIYRVNARGKAADGGDRNARNEAGRTAPPHLGLLKARLLFDGAYFQGARDELDKIDNQKLTDDEQLEYLYRTGRILHGLKDYDGALAFYERTIQRGRNSPHFFACNAALQAGLVEERRQRYERAAAYFRTCLDIQPDEYRAGLHMQAKAGLSRVR